MVTSTSSSQSLDRLVGTAAIIGLSLAVVIQWLTSSPSDESSDVVVFDQDDDAKNQLQQRGDRNTAVGESPGRRKNDEKKSAASSWWWPIAIMSKRRKKKRRYHDNNDNIANHGRNLDVDSSYNEDGYCDHLGSCECGSIRFILKGPKHLHPIQSPGKMQYPHILTSANDFHLLQGEADMRFQYVQDDDENNNTTNNNGDDSSTIATEHHAFSSGAHVFCGNCGVHVMHADRSSAELEVNANCLLEGQHQASSTHSSPFREEKQQQEQQRQMQQQTSSMSSLSTNDGDAANNDLASSMRQQQQQLNSVSEHELFLGGSAQFWNELEDNRINTGDPKNAHHPRTESIASMGEQTHTTVVDTPTPTDDYSMDGSSSVTASVLSVNTGLLPPLPPSRGAPLSSSSSVSGSGSVRTLPPWFGERPGYASHASRSMGGGWSVASMEPTNDLDSVGGESHTVSPRMRDQMKYYLSRHTVNKKKSEKQR